MTLKKDYLKMKEEREYYKRRCEVLTLEIIRLNSPNKVRRFTWEDFEAYKKGKKISEQTGSDKPLEKISTANGTLINKKMLLEKEKTK